MQVEKLIEVLEAAILAEKTAPPQPKYKDFTETKEGLIVGRHWVYLMQAWEEQSLPGWHYTVKTSERLGDCSIIHESNIAEILIHKTVEIPEAEDFSSTEGVPLQNAVAYVLHQQFPTIDPKKINATESGTLEVQAEGNGFDILIQEEKHSILAQITFQGLDRDISVWAATPGKAIAKLKQQTQTELNALQEALGGE